MPLMQCSRPHQRPGCCLPFPDSPTKQSHWAEGHLGSVPSSAPILLHYRGQVASPVLRLDLPICVRGDSDYYVPPTLNPQLPRDPPLPGVATRGRIRPVFDPLGYRRPPREAGRGRACSPRAGALLTQASWWVHLLRLSSWFLQTSPNLLQQRWRRHPSQGQRPSEFNVSCLKC